MVWSSFTIMGWIFIQDPGRRKKPCTLLTVGTTKHDRYNDGMEPVGMKFQTLSWDPVTGRIAPPAFEYFGYVDGRYGGIKRS